MNKSTRVAAEAKLCDDIGRIADAIECIADALHRVYGPPDVLDERVGDAR